MDSIKAYILDLDGTLLDTKPDLMAAHNSCLKALGFPERSEAEYGKIIGGGILDAIKKACPPGTDEDTIKKYNEMYQKLYPARCTEKTRHYDGMPDFLELCEKKGVALAVLTNKTQPTAVKIINAYFSKVNFAFIWGNDGVRPLKPAPDAGFAACKALGLAPENVAYVGDSGTDMTFALACGMKPFGACWGYRGRDELEKAGAEVLAAQPMELL